MKNLSLVLLLSLILLSGMVSADWSNEAKCGDGICQAGFRLGPQLNSQIEDVSTCFGDCKTTDWAFCEVDSKSGGDCNFNGKSLKLSNLQRNGCGGQSGSFLAFEVNYNGHDINMSSFPYVYTPLIDDIQITYDIWPCAIETSKQGIYIVSTLDQNKFNNFMQVVTTNINLKGDTNLNVLFDTKNLSVPNVDFKIINNADNEILTAQTGLGISRLFNQVLDPSATKPGKYTASAKLFDQTGTHLLAQKSSDIIINGCLQNAECDDSKFWTRNVCSGIDYKVCSNPLNWVLISIPIAIILVIVLVILSRKKQSSISAQ